MTEFALAKNRTGHAFTHQFYDGEPEAYGVFVCCGFGAQACEGDEELLLIFAGYTGSLIANGEEHLIFVGFHGEPDTGSW